MDTKVNDKSIEVLKQEYESIFEDRHRNMTVNHGKIQNYLVMIIYYMNKGLYKTTMFDYIK